MRSLDEFLDNAPSGPGPRDDLDKMLSGENQAAQFGAALKGGVQRNPATAAEVLRLKDKTGLPEQVIESDLPGIQERSRFADIDPVKYQKAAPEVAKWMAQSPVNAAAASEDLGPLAYISKQFRHIKNRFKIGNNGTRLSEIGVNAFLEKVTPQEREEQGYIERENAEIESDDVGIKGFWEGIPGAVAEQTPIMGRLILDQIKGGAVGGVLGAGTGAGTALLAGQAGPQAATPEEIVTVPAAAVAGGLTGMATGAKVGGALSGGLMELGHAFLEYEKMESGGRPLDRNVAKGAALMVGVINGSLEMVGLGTITKTIPGLRVLTRSGVRKILQNPTMNKAFLEYAKSVGGAVAGEGFTEAMQEMVTMTAGTLASMHQDGSLYNSSPGTIIDRLFNEETMGKALHAGRAGMQAGGGMTAVTSLHDFHKNRQDAKAAEGMKNAFLALGEGVKNTKLFQRVPEKMQEIVQELTKDGAVETLYVPVQRWNEYWSAVKDAEGLPLDPGDVAQEVIGNREAYDESLKTGQDIAIPTARYAVTIAPGPHNAFFVNEISDNPTIQNEREFQETTLKKMQELEQAEAPTLSPDDQAAKEVEQYMLQQYREGGMEESEAGAKAFLDSRRAVQRARQKGQDVDPVKLFQEIERTVTFEQDPTTEAVGSTSSFEQGAIDQSKKPPAPIPAATRSPLGFYSQVEEEVQKMDFKAMPPKDFMNRIKNIPGLKQEELEYMGLEDFLKSIEGKVTKPQLLKFISNNGLLLKQLVLAKDFKGKGEDGEGFTWGEPEWQDPDPDGYLASEEADYFLDNLEDYFSEGDIEAAKEEIIEDIADENGEYDEESLERKLRRRFEDQAHRLAQESIEDPGGPYAIHRIDLEVASDHSGNYYIEGSDDRGWWGFYYNNRNGRQESVELGSDQEEAKIQFIGHLIDSGIIEADIQDIIQEKDISFRTTGELPNYKTIEKKAKTLIKKDRERLVARVKEEVPWVYEDVTPEEAKDREAAAIFRIAKNEIEDTYHDPKNKRNKITIRINHPTHDYLAIEGNEVKGWTLTESERKRYGDTTTVRSISLGAKSVEEAKADALEVLREWKLLAPKKDPSTVEDVNAPIGKTQHTSHGRVLPGGENHREILLTLPNAEGKFVEHAHFSQPNIVVFIRISERVDAQGRRVLFIEELQSDWHQQGREEGYKRKVPQDLLDRRHLLGADYSNAKNKLKTLLQSLNYDNLGFTYPSDALSAILSHSDYAERWDVKDTEFIEAAEEYRSTWQAYSEVGARIEAMRRGVPDAPFKQTDAWMGLGLKRIIRLAAEQGYDAVAWAPGKVHSDRWGTDSVSWQKVETEEGSHFLVGSVEQRGGRVDGVNIEEAARQRGLLLERNGEIVRTKEELENVLVDTLHRQRTDRSLKSLTESIWKQMQTESSGTRRPREEGLQWMYDDALPRKVAPTVLKRLGSSAKVEKTTIPLPATGLTRHIYEGPSYTKQELIDLKNGHNQSANVTYALRDVIDGMNDVDGFQQSMDKHGNMLLAEFLGGKMVPDPEALKQEAHVIPLTPDLKESVLTKGMTLFHESKDGPRARVEMNNKSIKIILNKQTDFSSTLHEASHIWLKELFEDAQDPNSSQQVKDDMALVQNWWVEKADHIFELSKNHDPYKITEADGQAILEGPKGRKEIFATLAEAQERKTVLLASLQEEFKQYGPGVIQGLAHNFMVEQQSEALEIIRIQLHEYFARGGEAYFMEGRAPTLALKEVFAKFKAWMIELYKRLSALEVELNDDVRRVFDRLIASEQEISQAREEVHMRPLFEGSAQHFMTSEEAAKYDSDVREAIDNQEAELGAKLMMDIKKVKNAKYQERKEIVRKEVTDEVNRQPVYRALNLFSTGTSFLEGEPIPEGTEKLKLDRAAIVNSFGGEERLQRLKRPGESYVYQKEGGLHPDDAAALFGFGSGDELLTAIEQAEPKGKVIDRITNQRIQEEHPDLLTDEKLKEVAMQVVHKKGQSEVYLKELEYLASEKLATFKGLIKKVTKRLPKIEAIREQAEEEMNRKAYKNINPHLYQVAEARAGREAMELFMKGDIWGAFEAKERQLINHERYRAAVAAKERGEKIVNYAQKFNRQTIRQRIGRAGGDFLEQIDALMERFDFKKAVSLKQIGKRKSLLAWYQEKVEEGFPPNIPAKYLNEAYRTHFKDLTMEELEDLDSILKNLEHLAMTKNELISTKERRALVRIEEEIVSSIGANHDLTKTPPKGIYGIKDMVKDWGDQALAAHTKMEFLFRFLDGNKAVGTVWKYLFKPIADAEAKENEMMKGVVENMARIFGVYTKKERAFWHFHKIFIPEAKESLTKANIIAIALNQGNQYNKDALLEGRPDWNEKTIEAILSHLDERDWQVVQEIWDYFDTFWTEVSALEKRITGLTPQKVEAIPVFTKYGIKKGGYYPIVFDAKLSHRQNTLEAKENVEDLYGGQYAKAMTRHGHTIERTNTGKKPLLLELTGITKHLTNVVHDLAFREAILDVARLVNRDAIREAIESAAGREMYRQLNPWLANIASDRRGDIHNPMETLLSHARSGATVVNMGIKFTTAIVQFTGYLVSIKELGQKYGYQGLRKVFASPKKMKENLEFARKRSTMMAERMTNFDRDVRDSLKRLNVAGVKPGALSVIESYTHDVMASWFCLIGYMDMAVALPTWIAAYEKSMDGHVDNTKMGHEQEAIDYADHVVRTTQGGGGAKDLALVQRGSELFKIFTMFYSYGNVFFNQMMQTTQEYKMDKNFPKLIASLALMWFVPAVLEDLILGRGPDSDDDEKEWLKWALAQEVLHPFMGVVLFRDVANGLGRYLETGMDAKVTSPALDALDAMLLNPLKVGAKVVAGEEVKRKDYKNLFLGVGYLAKLPSRQVWQTGEYFYDWLNGDVRPDNPVEGLWQALVTGRQRK